MATECSGLSCDSVAAQFAHSAREVTGLVIILIATYAVFFICLITGACFKPLSFEPYNELGEKEQAPTGVIAQLHMKWRKAFVGKIYAILGIQLFVTVSMSSAMMFAGGLPLAKFLITDGMPLYYGAFIATFVTLIMLFCCGKSAEYPINLILLGLFTVAMSFMVGLTCTMYSVSGMGVIVLEAFTLTSVIFVALTLFTMQSRINWEFLGVGLFVAFIAFFFWGMIGFLIFPTFYFNQVYALFGALLFSGYIVYDTFNIMSTLTYDQYVLGAIELYLDFINLFLMILRCLGIVRSD
mmetsp:Transcript_32320/g.53465  ORF Transcript_32320/g.53465 Transcript_32320/m.53465 type:complete len:296 (-) Transcript_32320:198-1085(-)|eukprot:CAMPEP_0119311412 /NCGR_PEP_ID=MMETSP1333-20130426/22319_1 /TAXON_ID=418940 /ORGANISM="Scyphosphaera apsteinii, Strain RCC1455" /LENGTH=295 /DNA_ID=CAMNT_0007315775 /DNA_START=38 /DNA_END=925 /DNA_ORIENTATION=+